MKKSKGQEMGKDVFKISDLFKDCIKDNGCIPPDKRRPVGEVMANLERDLAQCRCFIAKKGLFREYIDFVLDGNNKGITRQDYHEWMLLALMAQADEKGLLRGRHSSTQKRKSGSGNI
jgi:hypothetical protein